MTPSTKPELYGDDRDLAGLQAAAEAQREADSIKPEASAPVPVVGGFVAYRDPTTGEPIYRNATDDEKEASKRYYAKLAPAEIQAMARVVITAESTDEAWAAASKVYVSELRYPAKRAEASAVVTREHRIAAFTALIPGEYGMTEWALRFLDTGETDAAHEKFARVAQAIADSGRASRDEDVERLRAENTVLRDAIVKTRDEVNAVKDEYFPCLAELNKLRAEAVTDEQLAEDIATVRAFVNTGNRSLIYRTEPAFDRITAALAGRGVR